MWLKRKKNKRLNKRETKEKRYKTEQQKEKNKAYEIKGKQRKEKLQKTTYSQDSMYFPL